MSRVTDKYDNYFLMYIKDRFKLLVQKDITVSLFVDEKILFWLWRW